MQNITIHFIFCIFIVGICWHVTFIDIVFVIFLGIVFVTFVDTLSAAFIISSHKLKYQQYFSTILTNTCAKITTAKFLSHAILFTLALPCIVISFLIWVTCCSIEFAFESHETCFVRVLASFILLIILNTLIFMWQQRDLNPQPLRNAQPFSRTGQLWSSVLSTYLYGALDCMLLSCHVWVSEWIYTL